MSLDYDYLIVGGGFSGLMTAYRIAATGGKVALLERGLCGTGASANNHGIVHSGAMFAILHPEITAECQEALQLFSKAFPNGIVCTTSTLYLAPKSLIESFKSAWRRQNIPHSIVPNDEVNSIIQPTKLKGLSAVAINDVIVSSRQLLIKLVEGCIKLGVDFHLMQGAHNVVVEDNKAVGVKVGLKEVMRASEIVLCSGLGTLDLWESFNSKLCPLLKSRLDIMVAFENKSLTRPVFCLEFGGPTLAPTINNMVLASLYGGKQPEITSGAKWSTPVSMATNTVRQVGEYIQHRVINLNSGRAYLCSKTEFSAGTADQWGVEPKFAVINHKMAENISNLWTLLPGKMTLVFHATRELVKQIQGNKTGLPLPILGNTTTNIINADKFVEKETWSIPG